VKASYKPADQVLPVFSKVQQVFANSTKFTEIRSSTDHFPG